MGLDLAHAFTKSVNIFPALEAYDFTVDMMVACSVSGLNTVLVSLNMSLCAFWYSSAGSSPRGISKSDESVSGAAAHLLVISANLSGNFSRLSEEESVSGR